MLTDEEIEQIRSAIVSKPIQPQWFAGAFARAVEAAVLAKVAQGEPVGEVYRHGKDSHGREWHGIHWYDANVDTPTGTKLYTRPAPVQQDEPVGWLPSAEWTPCCKLPVTVHVRKQLEGETHISTREGITPVKPDDLIMRGVQGEEYPIGREIFERTYRIGDAAPVQAQDDTALLRQCLKALENSGLSDDYRNYELASGAINALKARLGETN